MALYKRMVELYVDTNPLCSCLLAIFFAVQALNFAILMKYKKMHYSPWRLLERETNSFLLIIFGFFFCLFIPLPLPLPLTLEIEGQLSFSTRVVTLVLRIRIRNTLARPYSLHIQKSAAFHSGNILSPGE